MYNLNSVLLFQRDVQLFHNHCKELLVSLLYYKFRPMFLEYDQILLKNIVNGDFNVNGLKKRVSMKY